MRGIYRFLAIINDIRAVASGHVARRVKNRVVGRLLGQAGFWRRLWR